MGKRDGRGDAPGEGARIRGHNKVIPRGGLPHTPHVCSNVRKSSREVDCIGGGQSKLRLPCGLFISGGEGGSDRGHPTEDTDNGAQLAETYVPCPNDEARKAPKYTQFLWLAEDSACAHSSHLVDPDAIESPSFAS